MDAEQSVPNPRWAVQDKHLLWLRRGAPLKDIEEKIKQAFGAR
jgi:hypothetical protein